MGKKIQNYILDNAIGEGEFGKVYRATNQKNGQTVAIKIIKVEKFKMSPKLQEFTINEIQTLSKIEDTTHVVRFIQILKTANNYYFVYEYCNGGTLQQQIKRQGRFQEEKALAYFRDLLKAFQILVKSHIMHRDIKPSNILLHNGVIKLADFGFCKPLKDARDLSQTMLGSPIYMAPEILKGEVYTIKADIWSLGVVLYEMLFGFCPFEEKTIARLISLIDESAVTFPSQIQISKKTEELMRKMLVKDHFKRIGWEQLFSFDFSEEVETDKGKFTSANPFSKKATFTSIITEQVRNRYLNSIQNYNYKPTTGSNTQFRKKETKNMISGYEKKIIQGCLERRNKINRGLKLLKKILGENPSKVAVSVSSILSKKMRSLAKDTGDNLKKITTQKENNEKSGDLKKLLGMLEQEKNKVEEKLSVFEGEFEGMKEPQDIVLMKYAEEDGLTQEKEGLLQLLEVYDFMEDRVGEYSTLSKKELLEQYEGRIMKNR